MLNVGTYYTEERWCGGSKDSERWTTSSELTWFDIILTTYEIVRGEYDLHKKMGGEEGWEEKEAGETRGSGHTNAHQAISREVNLSRFCGANTPANPGSCSARRRVCPRLRRATQNWLSSPEHRRITTSSDLTLSSAISQIFHSDVESINLSSTRLAVSIYLRTLRPITLLVVQQWKVEATPSVAIYI